MTDRKPDLLGVIKLLPKGGRISSVFDGYRGHCQVNHSRMQYSYQINFFEQDELAPGESCRGNLTFVMGTIREIGLAIDLDTKLQLNEGGRNIGVFTIDEINQQ